jgi:hypothetical protein
LFSHTRQFSVLQRHQIGIYEEPLAIPPENEVKENRYHYKECPLEVKPPMDFRTFLHYMQHHSDGGPSTNPNGITVPRDPLFLPRLPKKVGSSILDCQKSGIAWGWGVRIIEGPNMVALSWTTFIILILSFLVSVLYCHFWRTQEQGFAIGQWLVAVLGTGTAAAYFHMSET